MSTPRFCPPYTADEREKLVSLYATSSEADLLAAFPGRSLSALRILAGKLKLTAPARYWTPKEDAILKDCYAQDGPHNLGKRLNRTPQGVKRRAARLGVRMYVRKPLPTALARTRATEHSEVPKAANTLRPMQVGTKEPSKRSSSTPVLNGRVEARRRDQAQTKGLSIAEEIRSLPANSVGRTVYMRAASQGGAAATAAFREWQRQQAA